jgi:hypothetical protein
MSACFSLSRSSRWSTFTRGKTIALIQSSDPGGTADMRAFVSEPEHSPSDKALKCLESPKQTWLSCFPAGVTYFQT